MAALAATAHFEPESFGRLGFPGINQMVTQFPPDRAEQRIGSLEAAEKQIVAHLAKERDPEVRFDLEVLIWSVRNELDRHRLEARLLAPYFNPARPIYEGFRALLADIAALGGSKGNQSDADDRREAALVRLARYTGREAGFRPLTAQAEAALKARLGDGSLLMPIRAAVERDLATNRHFITGISTLCERAGVPGYQVLRDQLATYDSFIRSEVLPRAREDFRLPAELYQCYLRDAGVDMPVDELVRRSQIALMETESEIGALAPAVARERGWTHTDYRDVIRELRRERIAADSILDHYRSRLDVLEELVERHTVVSLPARDLRILVASPAESATCPGPHLLVPPLIGNGGEPAELVVPHRDSEGGDPTGNDFNCVAASWAVALHEGRPGHELQYSTLLTNSLPVARSVAGYNQANTEGWAIYMESEMMPLLPRDAQLFLLQRRLLRMARILVEMALHFSHFDLAEARRRLLRAGTISEAKVRHELARAAYLWPGSGSAAVSGYNRFMELRAEVAWQLGANFDRKIFHDTLLKQGLVPLAVLRRRVVSDLATSENGY